MVGSPWVGVGVIAAVADPTKVLILLPAASQEALS